MLIQTHDSVRNQNLIVDQILIWVSDKWNTMFLPKIDQFTFRIKLKLPKFLLVCLVFIFIFNKYYTYLNMTK